jgi:electron transfer flavoprotein alpha subunit
MACLALIEHAGGQVRQSALSAITFASEVARLRGTDHELVLLGHGLAAAADQVMQYGAAAVLVADHPALSHPLADRYAAALAAVARARGVDTLVAASSTYSKDILPRTAALLNAGMLSDVTGVECVQGRLIFHRPVYAGNAIAAVELSGALRVLSCRPTAFPAPGRVETRSPIESIPVDPSDLPSGSEYGSREERASTRPELTEARVVVTGGRPLKDGETFLGLIGGLADVLGGAVGATRAAVDAGIAPNDWQVGQTGKVVAPELYIACGVSGAIQHLAGMKDSRVIVAINKDPEAPIFQVATYGLAADLYQAVPALTAALRKLQGNSGG